MSGSLWALNLCIHVKHKLTAVTRTGRVWISHEVTRVLSLSISFYSALSTGSSAHCGGLNYTELRSWAGPLYDAPWQCDGVLSYSIVRSQTARYIRESGGLPEGRAYYTGTEYTAQCAHHVDTILCTLYTVQYAPGGGGGGRRGRPIPLFTP